MFCGKARYDAVWFAALAAAAALLWLQPGTAEAARTFTVAQINPAPPAPFVMGTTQSVTFRVTNTSTAGNAGETITQVRFRVNGTYTTLSAGTSAPAGWTRTAFSATSVTFQANTNADRIPSGGFRDFTLVFIVGSSTADVVDQLRDVQARFSANKNVTINNPGSWTLKSLQMTLVPSTYNVGAACQFTLTMTVTNRSTANINGVTSSPKPPTRTGVNATTSSNPPNFNLNAGATGTMVWTYTAGVTPGSLTFTAFAQDNTGNRTSPSVTTLPITVTTGVSCTFTSAIAVTPACLFSGDAAVFTMTVSNTTGSALTNIVPSALTRFGTAVIGAFTGPAPASLASLANGATGTFTWTAPVTGNINDTYYVTGFAAATGPIQTAVATSNTQDLEGYTVTVNPAATNASSATAELTWTVANSGCGNITQVAIAVPGGWTLSADAYAVVDNTVGAQVDTWTPAGTTFTSPNATDRIPVGSSGDFSLLFSGTPPGAGASSFNVTITDDSTPVVVKTVPTTVTVNPFNSGSLNATGTGIWQEDVR